MRRAPGSPSAGLSLVGVMVFLLAILVIGGTAYGYSHWQSEIDRATDGTGATPTPRPNQSRLPTAPTSAPEEPEEPTYEPPTFELLQPTANRPQPVVLLVGDGYADGRGASSAGTAYPSLLARDLGWDVRLATRTGTGYLSAAPTVLDLFNASPAALDPDLVVVQAAYGANGSNDETKAAISELDAAIRARYADVPIVVVTAFAAEVTDQVETRERTVTRAWREDPAVLVLRPQVEGWADATPDDAGHALIAGRLEQALRAAGLAKA